MNIRLYIHVKKLSYQDIQKAQVKTIGFEDNPLQGRVKLAHKGA